MCKPEIKCELNGVISWARKMLCCGRRDGGRFLPIRSLSFLPCHPPMSPLAPASLRERHTELPRSIPNHRLSPFFSLPPLLAASTSPPRTRCGWGRGGSASWGLELPLSSSPSPSWATPSASQVPGLALGLGLRGAAACPGVCILMPGWGWRLRSKGRASRVIPKWISPPWLLPRSCWWREDVTLCFSPLANPLLQFHPRPVSDSLLSPSASRLQGPSVTLS